jgi:hypothetical protein
MHSRGLQVFPFGLERPVQAGSGDLQRPAADTAGGAIMLHARFPAAWVCCGAQGGLLLRHRRVRLPLSL